MRYQDWAGKIAEAWFAGVDGNRQHHRLLIEEANELVNHTVILSPALEWLRYNIGTPPKDAYVQQHIQTEDEVLGLIFSEGNTEAPTAAGMAETKINFEEIRANLKKFQCLAGVHAANISQEFPHLMILSTGRCGTVSMYRLLQRCNYLPYHVCPYNVPLQKRFEAMCQILSGNYDNPAPMLMWLASRAAEWLGAINLNLPVALVNHQDTIFAPGFAAIHPKSKFVYLRREPVEIYQSYYGKDQWGPSQLQPLLYKFSPDFQWRYTGWDLPEQIAWYIRFTEIFSRALGTVLGPHRFVEISANRLFAQNCGEIERLKDFLGLPLSVLEIQEHFGHPYNQKLHKAIYDPKKGIKAFDKAYSKL